MKTATLKAQVMNLQVKLEFSEQQNALCMVRRADGARQIALNSRHMTCYQLLGHACNLRDSAP